MTDNLTNLQTDNIPPTNMGGEGKATGEFPLSLSFAFNDLELSSRKCPVCNNKLKRKRIKNDSQEFYCKLCGFNKVIELEGYY